ncbi:YopX family protein [Dyadobacter sandarakinus]|uniref:YopX protein domain-containing protein n=1 Tax=Dyadobacter sandarakinus TaxID=2747268 RepID=A0ABX7I3D0_9BACT|nr:YopX family protein [Dyadobacter sandarakinus]QRQ99747.1 hypothetical protein HWI92_01845 [Dyadobacter sandarakinus]
MSSKQESKAMREIKFRGKSNADGTWHVGHIIREKDCMLIIGLVEWMDNTEFKIKDYHSVHAKTVGQFSGLGDKNGIEIYEGDICRMLGGEEHDGKRELDVKGSIQFEYGAFELVTKKKVCYSLSDRYDTIEIIGNIHDNPDLLS